MVTPQIVIFGAGSIGCYLGGCLTAAGCDVTFIGRARLRQELSQHGLRLTDWRGRNDVVLADSIKFQEAPQALSGADIILVTVKGGDTEQVAQEIAAHAKPGILVVSFQNGLRNGELLTQNLPGQRVARGMVPFNVAHLGQGRFHCGTEGDLAMETAAGQETALATAFGKAGLPVRLYPDLTAVQWGKLLLNLNNSINALAGVPLVQEFNSAGYRKALSACIGEALRIMQAAGIQPARMGKLVPALLPYVLLLPTPLFRLLARAMLKMDPQARSSMADDLQARRKTEIEFLNGEIVRLASEMRMAAPINRKVVELVRQAEAAQQGSPQLSAERLLAELLGQS